MIISKTPFRASFFGGGSDLSEYYRNGKYGYGCVLSTAINMHTYITVNEKFDDKIRVGYSQTELVDSVEEIKHNVIREALKIAEIKKGIDIVYMADIPMGSAGVGLASSSALAVGVLNALFAYKGEHVSAEFLAQKACEIEIERLENPIGKQDQYAVAYGGFERYQFNQDETVFVDPIICNHEIKSELQKHLMFFYTGITRISSSILEEQRENTVKKLNILDQMIDITNEAQETIYQNKLVEFGALLHETWLLKKQLSKGVSNNEIDNMYQAARKEGAIGGKVLGAGGGGFLMLYVPFDCQDRVRQVLYKYKECKVAFEPQGSKIIYVSE